MLGDLGALAAELAIKVLGDNGTATLTRPNTLTVDELYLTSAVLAGAVTLTAQAGDLTGKAKAGSKFTVAGVAGTYTVSADSEASGGAVALAFTPALASGAASGAKLTFTQTYGTATFSFMRGSQQEAEANDLVKDGERAYLLLAEPGEPSPEESVDLLSTPDGVNLPVQKAHALGSAGTTHYRIIVGAAS